MLAGSFLSSWTKNYESKCDPNHLLATTVAMGINVRCSDLTRLQQKLLGKLYSCFRKKEFTIREAARGIGCNESSLDFHLYNFAERGIMEIHEHSKYPNRAQGYSFMVFPKDHPQCFRMDAGHSVALSGSGYSTEPVLMGCLH